MNTITTTRSRGRTVRALIALAGSGALLAACATEAPGAPAPTASEPAAVATIVQSTAYAEIDPALIEAAETESGSLVMYDSTPDDKVNELFAAFREDFPFVTETKHVLLRAAEVATRVLQESQAGVATADVAITGGPALTDLSERDLLLDVDWSAIGVPDELVANDQLIATAASIYVIIYNTDRVAEEDAPGGWDDLLDPKWAGKISMMSDPLPIAQLVPVLGGDKVTELWQGIAVQSPVMVQDTVAVANAVASGEAEIGIGHFHATQPAISAGAPVEIVFPSPVALSLLYSAIPSGGDNPATGKLFAAWLATEKGAKLNESISRRGNPFLPTTEAAELLKGREISAFAPQDAGQLNQWLSTLSR